MIQYTFFRRSMWLVALAVVLCARPNRPAAAADLAEAEEKALQAAVRSVADSVVQIQTVGGLERVGQLLTSTAPTSGVIVSPEGHIISSSFNFVQEPSAVLVTLPTGKEHSAQIVSRDTSRHLVLLKIETDETLVVPAAVPSHEFRVGQWAIAVGKSFDPVEPNISVGILSATNRIWGRALQTDAKVSPVNYGGPLVDIRGRVMGILAPLSNEEGSELAGAEMYDSGIGFAVPLSEIQQRLASMIAGEQLDAGLLGLTLQGKDLYRGQPIVASSAPKSPARAAGILPDDEIAEVNGIPVSNQAELKHAIGPLYAGDEVDLVLLRDGQRQQVTVTLAAKIEPYVLPFLGILPRRDEQQLVIRFVYPESPAAKVQLMPGDRLLTIDGVTPSHVDAWRTLLADRDLESPVALGYVRGEQQLNANVVLAKLPEEIPADLPSIDESSAENVSFDSLSLPEEPNKCWALVPASHEVGKPHALVVWLAPPNFEKEAEFEDRWRALCAEHQLIVIAPQPQLPNRWLPAEATVIQKFIDGAIQTYEIDPMRIVVHGYQAGGSMAHRVALSHRDLIRGVAVADATIPRGSKISSNDPVDRLAYYLFTTEKSRLKARIERDAEGLRGIQFPVTERVVAGPERYLATDELAELCRWMDALDRL